MNTIKSIVLITALTISSAQASSKSRKKSTHWLKTAIVAGLLLLQPGAAQQYITETRPLDLLNRHKFRNGIHLENVFGEDNRDILDSMDSYPENTVGILAYSNSAKSYICTFTLMNEYIIGTNRHCLPLNDNHTVDPSFWTDTSFYLGYSKGAYLEASTPFKVTYPEGPPSHANDHALIQTEDPIGSAYGWPEIEPTTIKQVIANNQTVTSVGYSGDILQDYDTASKHVNCQTTGAARVDGELIATHNCDMTAGASGSPILKFENGKYVIIGLNNAEVIYPGGSNVPELLADEYPNFFQVSDLFIDAFRDFQVELPPNPRDIKEVDPNPDRRPNPKPIWIPGSQTPSPSKTQNLSPSNSPSPTPSDYQNSGRSIFNKWQLLLVPLEIVACFTFIFG